MIPKELGVRLEGEVYRAHNPTWAWTSESGEGAARKGGRWNRPGVPALYTSETVATAWAEYQQGFAGRTQPVTICTYEVDSQPIVDLNNPQVRQLLGEQFDGWETEDWLTKRLRGQEAITWRIVDQLVDAGYAGIRVPSYAPNHPEGACNVVFFEWTQESPTKVRVIDDDGLLQQRPPTP